MKVDLYPDNLLIQPDTILLAILLVGVVFSVFYFNSLYIIDKISPQDKMSDKEYYLSEFYKVFIFSGMFIASIYVDSIFASINNILLSEVFIFIGYPIYLLMTYIEMKIKDRSLYNFYYTRGLMFAIGFYVSYEMIGNDLYLFLT